MTGTWKRRKLLGIVLTEAEENQGVNPVAKTSESGTMESDNLGGNESTKSFHSQLSKSPVRTIESPKYGLQLSPI